MDRDLNKVIIIGTDHHNVLGTVRCFGVNGIKPYGIIVKNDDSPLWVTKSRYWRQTIVIGDDSEIYDALVKNFGNEMKKPVVICCSDGAMCFIDRNLDRLKDRFILPSLNGEQGAITRLMNKETQQEFLEQQGIHMLESRIIDLTAESSCHDLDYPVILKPVASVEGDKKDIVICDSEESALRDLAEFGRLGYKRILCQHYLRNVEEYLLTGAVSKRTVSYVICKIIRQWPVKTGSGSYSVFSHDETTLCYIDSVMKQLQKLGFSGTIDIEFFKTDEGYCINEINWRTSGFNHVSLFTKEYSSYYYYLSVTDQDFRHDDHFVKNGFIMNEGADLRNALIAKNVSILTWFAQLFTVKTFAFWFWKDLRPAFSRYLYYFRKYVSGNE